MSQRARTIALLVVACLVVYFGKQRFLGRHLASMFLNELVPADKANDTTRPATMDPLQMVYLTWAAGDALRHGRLLVEDRHQFASSVEKFRPVVLDPLVYLGGALSLIVPLALAYNLGQVVLPLLILAIAFYSLLRALALARSVAFGFALLVPFIPYRLLNSAMGQHNAASVCLIPIFYWCATQVVLRNERRWFALAGIALLLIGCSEEHLAVATILFGWPFLITHLLIFAAREPGRLRGATLTHWLRSLAHNGWPFLPSVAALLALALDERHKLVEQSIVRHVYGYDVISMYSVEFNENYFHHTVGWHLVLLPVALAGIGVVVAQLRRRRPDDVVPFARFAFVLVFVPSTLASLGHVPSLARLVGFDFYRVLFEHVPFFDMQRYPHRMLYTAYLGGLAVAACAVDAAVGRVGTSPRRATIAGVAAVVALAVAAVNWVDKAPTTAFYDLSRDPDAALDREIRGTAGRDQIVLRLPALSGSMWSDTRTMLTAMRTGARFFNGYWAFMPKIYRELQPSLQRLGDNGLLLPELRAELDRIGVRFVLVDKAYVKERAVAELRQHPSLELLYEDVGWAYFRLHDN